MKILFLTNLYPPYHMGGYELACRDAVDALKAMGHEVAVLTGTRGVKGVEPCNVHRVLPAFGEWGGPKQNYSSWGKWTRDWSSGRAYRRLCGEFRPDVLFVWNMQKLSGRPLRCAAGGSLAVVYYVFDHWLARALKSGGGSSDFIVPGSKYIFASNFLLKEAVEAGLPSPSTCVIHWGIKAVKQQVDRADRQMTRLLYAGQVVRHKGVHTAVQAVAELARRGIETTLSVIGGSVDAAYVCELKKLAETSGVSGKVMFKGEMDRESLAGEYASHDVLLFTSTWEEPFGIVLLEAMTHGVVVAGTATGGSAEILRDGINGLVFRKEDVSDCAAKIEILMRNRDLAARLRDAARATVLTEFDEQISITRLEKELGDAIAGGRKS